MSDKKEIPNTKNNSIYAQFYDKDHMQDCFEHLLNGLPKKCRFDVIVYVGQLQTTYDYGFSKNKKESESNNDES